MQGINAINQSLIQRFLSVPTLKKARCALWIYITGVILFITVSAYNGFILYATYYDCDPLTTKVINFLQGFCIQPRQVLQFCLFGLFKVSKSKGSNDAVVSDESTR